MYVRSHRRPRVLATNVPRVKKTEKMAVNMGVVDLGQVDLLVQEGFYSNRSDLVRTAVRNQLVQHADVLKQTVARRSLTLGLQHFSRADLEQAVAAGERLQIEVVGLARIAADVTPALAKAAIASCREERRSPKRSLRSVRPASTRR